jgi:hypothetical protein
LASRVDAACTNYGAGHGFLVIVHRRRELLHLGVTKHPTAEWTANQFREAFPLAPVPRFLFRDRDAIFGVRFTETVKALAIQELITAPRSPWQNPFAERVVGSIRRDLLHHVIVLNERFSTPAFLTDSSLSPARAGPARPDCSLAAITSTRRPERRRGCRRATPFAYCASTRTRTTTPCVLISRVVSLTTTPMMCARLLAHAHRPRRSTGGSTSLTYRASERGFSWALRTYQRSLSSVLRHPAATLGVLRANSATLAFPQAGRAKFAFARPAMVAAMAGGVSCSSVVDGHVSAGGGTCGPTAVRGAGTRVASSNPSRRFRKRPSSTMTVMMAVVLVFSCREHR